MSDPAIQPFSGAVDYPPAVSVGQLLAAQIARRPNAKALQMVDGAAWTWTQLGTEVASIQAGLEAFGIKPGDHVAMLCDNSLRMAAMLCAVISYGAVAIPINTGLIGKGLHAILLHSDAKLLVVDAPYLARCKEVGVIDASRCVLTEAGEGAHSWESVFGKPGTLIARGEPADIAVILYTSGTTGDSKGAMLSHTSLLLAAWASAAVMFEAKPGDVIYTALPLFHCAAQQLGLWTVLLSGAELVLAPRFSASNFWRHMRDYNVNAFHFVGPITSVLWSLPPSEQDRNHSVRIAAGGGPRIAWREFEERFGLQFVECYGMTETFGGCVTHRPGHGRSGYGGKALYYVDAKIVDDNGAELPVDERGRIMLRARVRDAFFSGYYKRPDLTEAAFNDGWYVTGDIGSMDKDGYLIWHSRARDIIRHRGENISAVDVEALIAEHPLVAECGVVGVPAELGEEDVFAVIVPTAQPPEISDIVAFLSERLPPFAIPRFFAFADSLPKTATSRIQRHLLAPFLNAAHDRGTAKRQHRTESK